jgi:hypothetical protein
MIDAQDAAAEINHPAPQFCHLEIGHTISKLPPGTVW